MKTRPILFSGPMVRALLTGTKTQTRRIVKPQPEFSAESIAVLQGNRPGISLSQIVNDAWQAGFVDVACPYGVPDDRLWVRETWGIESPYENETGAPMIPCYRADGEDQKPWDGRWRPSIHMHRADSRLTLEITDVRVQRLQEISEEDAEAEGIERNRWADGTWHPFDGWVDPTTDPDDFPAQSAQEAYANLWDSIHGDGSWAANPWVWAVSFKRVDA